MPQMPPLSVQQDSNGNASLKSALGRIQLSGTQRFKPPHMLKRFVDERNITFSPGTLSSFTHSIDQNSPFGHPALKIVATAGNAVQYGEVIFTDVNIPNFDDNIGVDVWLDDPNKLTQISTYLGNNAFVKYKQYNKIIAQGGDKIGGRRVIHAGPAKTVSSDGGFAYGTDSLQWIKQRFSVVPNQTVTFWIDAFMLLQRQRALVMFTSDDNFANWNTEVAPVYATNNVLATFGHNTQYTLANNSKTDGSQNPSSDPTTNVTTYPCIGWNGLAQLAAAGHQISSHCVFNYKLRTLDSTGNGENVGTGGQAQSRKAVDYLTDFRTARELITANAGVPRTHCNYHPWVQGGMDQTAMEFMRSEGLELVRSTYTPYDMELYGHELGNNAYALNSIPLGWGTNPTTGAINYVYTLADYTAMIDKCEKYGGMLIFMHHNTGATSSDSVTVDRTIFAGLVQYAAQRRDAGGIDILRMMDLAELLNRMGLLRRMDVNPKPVVRQIGELLTADFNTVGNQTITLIPGNFIVTEIRETNCTTNLTTAQAGYTSGGNTLVPTTQTHTGLTGTATQVLTLPSQYSQTVSGTVIKTVSVAQGATATGDVFVFGYPA